MVTEGNMEPRFSGEALMGRLFEQAVGALELLSMYLGERLGLYGALAAGGAATAGELAERAGIAPRYAREWLEQQTVAGIVDVDDPAVHEDVRRYSLPDEHRETLLDEDSLGYLGFLPRFIRSAATAMPAVMEAFRTGGGVPWSAYGADMREAQAAQNRPLSLSVVGQEWFASVPDLHERLRGPAPARIADFACGEGWLSIGLAKAYPDARVTGFDFDPASIEAARRHAVDAGVADRVAFELGDVAERAATEAFDVAVIFEALHDLSRPVEALRAMRGMLAPDGVMLVIDERAAERFTGLALDDLVERLLYAFSTTVCLPNGLAEQPSAATGTVMRPSTLERYAREAGFREMEILPIEHDVFRVYRLRQ